MSVIDEEDGYPAAYHVEIEMATGCDNHNDSIIGVTNRVGRTAFRK